MITLGLTGSIGMGKSTTAGLFRAAGVPVFDSDAVVHELYRGAAAPAIERAFPGTVEAGVVDRAKLGALVLRDAASLGRLEAIVHPLVGRARDAFLAEQRAAGMPVAVLDVPLLFETGGERHVDAVVVVSAPESVQKARVMARPGMTPETFSAIKAKQVPDAEKRRRARYVVETGEGLEPARRQVLRILEDVTSQANRSRGSAQGTSMEM